MRILFLPVIAACAATAIAATAQTLKPGLWQMQQSAGGKADSGMAGMEQAMAGMSPEQRKQMEAMMARRGRVLAPTGDGGMAMKVCLTREMIDRNDIPAIRGKCQIGRQQRSGNTLNIAFTCSDPPSKGDSQVVLDSPEAFTIHTDVTTTGTAQPERMSMAGSGKWLSTDCGDVKPVQAK